MVVPRNRFFNRVTRDEASAVVGAVVDAWRMWVGWDNGLLKTGHDGWCRWDGGSRERTCEWQRRSLMDGGLIIVAMRLIISVVEACCWWICVAVDDSICPCSRARPVPGGDQSPNIYSTFAVWSTRTSLGYIESRSSVIVS